MPDRNEGNNSPDSRIPRGASQDRPLIHAGPNADGTVSAAPSVHDLVPDEPGAEAARRGFSFQDHVAAGFFLEMAEDRGLTTVWCEADDDVTLVWELVHRQGGVDGQLNDGTDIQSDGIECEVEFVQVKGEEHNQLWSPSLLCRPVSRGGRQLPASSMLEKSLSHDRYREPARFRIVTIRPVQTDLRMLELPLDHATRQPSSHAFQSLADALADDVKTRTSPNGNTWEYWLARTFWDVRHSEDAVRDKNQLRLETILRRLRGYLAPDQRAVIYERLVRRAYDAAVARGQHDATRKRLCHDELLLLLRQAVAAAQHAGATDDISPLERKLTAAALSKVTVRHAKEIRRRYLRARRSSPYFSGVARAQAERLEGEVASRLHQLWAQFEAGAIDETPAAFYSRCLSELDAIRRELPPEGAPSLELMQGMMYDRVQRCLLRFDHAAD